MKPLILFFTLLIPLAFSATSRADDQTVTIYFSGTTMNSTMWRSAMSPFGRPETIATLHYLQKSGGAYQNHHKGIVDGFEDVFEISVSPNWEKNFYKAVDILMPVTHYCDGQCITLNLVGFSRGAVSTLHFVKNLLTRTEYASVAAKVRRINILAFDPVPGDARLDPNTFDLTEALDNIDFEYVGFYAIDERTALFTPVFPRIPVKPNVTVNLFRIPGSHETLVGNTRKNGHRKSIAHNEFVEELDRIPYILKIVATEMLGSSAWGKVRFLTSPDPGLNLNWYESETSVNLLRDRFNGKIDSVLAYPDYQIMHKYSFYLLLESWNRLCQPAGFFPLVSPNNPRCVYDWPYYTPQRVWISSAPLDAVSDVQSTDRLWNLIKTRGSLDVDADLVDYNDDNCPLAANPGQEDFDGDSLGDVCDTDSDADGVPDISDRCAHTPLDEAVDVKNGCSNTQV